MRGFIHLLKVNIGLAQIDRIHSAADIHTNHVGDDLVQNRHGRPNGAADSRMDIRHNADTASCSELAVAHSADLLDGFILSNLRIAERSIHLAFNLKHSLLLQIALLFLRQPFRCLSFSRI